MKFSFGNLLILNQMVFGIQEFRDVRELSQMSIKNVLQTFRYCMQQYNAYDVNEGYLQDICMQQQRSPATMVLQRRKRSYMAGLVPKRYLNITYFIKAYTS